MNKESTVNVQVKKSSFKDFLRKPEVENYAEFCFSHSRMMSFTRVCHPLPVALSAVITSTSRRSVTGAFFGCACGERPAMQTSDFAAFHSASVTSCASGSSIAAVRMRASSSWVFSKFHYKTAWTAAQKTMLDLRLASHFKRLERNYSRDIF